MENSKLEKCEKKLVGYLEEIPWVLVGFVAFVFMIVVALILGIQAAYF